MMQSPGIPSREAYDRIVQDILSQPGYRHLRLPWTDLFEDARRYVEGWIIEMLQKLFSQPAVSTPFTGGFSVFVIILGAVALIGLVFLTIGLFGGMFGRSPKVHGILGETITAETTPETLMDKAKAAERSGDIRQAVRFGFIAVLLKMHRARLVFLDETWTNQELYQHLEKNRFTSLTALSAVMEGFNAAWYGHKLFGSAAYEKWKSSLDQVWQEVNSREI